MKTVPFSDILASVCQLVGLDRNTLNDKSFGAVRDMVGRRISTIWDREEWPDTERYLNTWPGNPVQGVTVVSSTATDMVIRIALDINFPRIYLIDFPEENFRKNTIGTTNVKFSNPFYILKGDGSRVSVSDQEHTFTYLTANSNNGEYIVSVDITVPLGTVEYPSYLGFNSPFTTKIIFASNQNLIIQLEDDMLQGLEVYTNDTRQNTRCTFESFLVEDKPPKDDVATSGTYTQQEYSYLRFLTDSEKFIKYRLISPRLFGQKYSSTNSYYVGSQAFYDPAQGTADYNPSLPGLPIRGNFWNCIQNNLLPAPTAPAPTSAFWKMVEIPYRFKDYLINGTSADFIRSEGRTEEANVFDQLAEVAVQQQIDVLLRQQQQVQKMKMVYTY
jgi:hypothetical protein